MSRASRTRRLPTSLLKSLAIGCALGAAGCGGDDAAAAGAAAGGAVADARSEARSTTLGTIQATVDGEARTWYVVAGEAADGPYASGTWMEWEEGTYMLSLGGLDSEDPPIGTFHRGGASGAMSMGDYRGGAFTVTAQLGPSDAPATFAVPDDEQLAGAIFAPVVDMEDMTNALVMVSGTVQVAELEMSGTTLDARGTFSGTFEPMDGGAAVEFTDGSFEVRGLPHANEIQPTDVPPPPS